MPILVHYVYETPPVVDGPPPVGRIVSVWQAIPAAWLDSQTPQGEPPPVARQFDVDLDPREVLMAYYVLGATLTAKAVLTLTATPNPFPADGVTVCQVSVTPFVPCTVLVETTTPLALTEADPLGEVTTTTPGPIQITLQPMTQYRADPPILIVEAQ
jgi:hypothetical protein